MLGVAYPLNRNQQFSLFLLNDGWTVLIFGAAKNIVGFKRMVGNGNVAENFSNVNL